MHKNIYFFSSFLLLIQLLSLPLQRGFNTSDEIHNRIVRIIIEFKGLDTPLFAGRGGFFYLLGNGLFPSFILKFNT